MNEQSQEPIQNFGVIVAGPCPADLWEDIEGGGRRSRAILEGHWQTLLVKPQTDGPTLFSGVLPLSTRRQRVTHLRNIWLSPGAVLRGRLSKNVPRPVTGYVVAAAFPRPAGKVYDVENPTLVWYDWVEIDRDGRFEFESLPGGGEVQLMAFCDGWIAVTDPEIAGAKHFEMGQLFPLDQPAVDVELKMEQTGTLQVELLAPDGTPLTEGEITSSPNQMFYLGAAGGILGQRIRSIDNIRNQFLTPGKRLEPEDYNLKLPFRKPVNPDGPTTLTGLPLNRPLKLFLIHKQLTLQSPARIGIFNVAPFNLQTATPQQLKLQTIVHQPDP